MESPIRCPFLSLGGRIMLDVLNKVEHYHSLAKEYRRLAAFSLSAQMQNHYPQLADHYSTLAEAEERSPVPSA